MQSLKHHFLLAMPGLGLTGDYFANTITYVVAVPKPGYRRTLDVESAHKVEQRFENGRQRSSIEAECSDGVVHARVEEESVGD